MEDRKMEQVEQLKLSLKLSSKKVIYRFFNDFHIIDGVVKKISIQGGSRKIDIEEAGSKHKFFN